MSFLGKCAGRAPPNVLLECRTGLRPSKLMHMNQPPESELIEGARMSAHD
jgi:hypothetical protein